VRGTLLQALALLLICFGSDNNNEM